MLFKTDSLFGHIIEDSPGGPVYQDDGSKVDFENPRPCLGCKARCKTGEHDPCIPNLPGTYQACCGHGMERSPSGNRPAGYVGLKDGRTLEFSGQVGGERICEAVAAALGGQELPDGFSFGQRMWWEGLTDAQRDYVWAHMRDGLEKEVRALGDANLPSQAFLRGEKLWHDGLSEEQKGVVLRRMPAMIVELVQEARLAHP